MKFGADKFVVLSLQKSTKGFNLFLTEGRAIEQRERGDYFADRQIKECLKEIAENLTEVREGIKEMI